MNIGAGLNKQKVKEFFTAYKKGNLVAYLKSQEVPEAQDSSLIMQIVANNFEFMVLDSEYDAVVIFDGNQCDYCKVLYKLYETVAHRLQTNRMIRFFIVNTSENEIPGIEEVGQRPEVLYYAARDKQQPLKFSTIRRESVVISEIQRVTS